MVRSQVNSWSDIAMDGSSRKPSSYPELEWSYLQRKYGSDDLTQRHDRHAEKGVHRYCLANRKTELSGIVKRIGKLTCSNQPGLAPGRHAVILSQLRDNLALFEQPDHQSFRWNEHYQQAIEVTSREIVNHVKARMCGKLLQPASLKEVAESEAITRNGDKHAGYVAFLTGSRSKRDNLSYALKWCEDNVEAVVQKGSYGLPVTMAHRSSNSKIDDWDAGTWKARCRIVSMADLRQQLFDGRFEQPFNASCLDLDWSEGGLSHQEVENWIRTQRLNYKYYYSSDYSKFDTSQSGWLIEDVFRRVIRPCFSLSEEDENLFDVMVHSYIHKEIHGFDGVHIAHKGNLSGSFWTYWINTIVNEVVDRTALLIQGVDISRVKSLKCGDDNIVFHSDEKFDPKAHAQIIERFFGIRTTIGDKDFGTSSTAPRFLSRTWEYDGAARPVQEIVWNLIYPERFRDYFKSGMPESQAVALLFYCAYLEQPLSMKEWFDIEAVVRDAKLETYNSDSAYRMLAKAGTGFYTSWINFHLSSSKLQDTVALG